MSNKVYAVFEAADRNELAARYDDWAQDYEGDLAGMGGPQETIERLASYVPSTQARILDAGCGTGVVGQVLAERGYTHLEGLDLSAGMLDEARKKGCYAGLTQGALGEVLDFPTGTFDAIVSVGVFVRGHAPSSSFDELIRITKPGGYLVFTLRPEFYAGTDFKDKMTALEQAGRWRLVEVGAPFDGRFKAHPDVNLQVWVYRIPESEWLLSEFNNTAQPYPADRCLHQLVEAQVACSPEAVALVFEELELTYAQLNERANRLAHFLISLGVGPETLVSLCVRRSPEMVIAMLAILKAGGAYVALDPAYPKARQAFMIEDAGSPLLLTQEELVAALPVTQARLIRLDTDWAMIDGFPGSNPQQVPLTQDRLAYVLYTSGSTGRPKGVAIEHRSVVAFLSWAQSVYSPKDLAGTLAGTSICFDLSVFEIFLPLCCGGTVILAENAIALPALPARKRVTLINTVPSAMAALVAAEAVPASVRIVNLAGEPLANRLVQDIYRPGTVEKVYNLYGPSEDTTYSTFVLAEKGVQEEPSIGRPIANTQVYIVNPDLQLTPIGTPGELCLAGLGLARGYLNRPDLTAERFLQNPFGPGRIYRTGDLARYRPDGNLEYLGRLDHQVKIRGFRIELGEIERTLEQHPAVEKAAVLALPDPRGEKQLAAFLVADSEAVETLADQADTQEHVAIWQTVYEETYRQTPVADDPTLNISGWKSSYTGLPIPESEMREWVDLTVGRILSLRPDRVLELGCGTGMLLARIAPHCAEYVGADFSNTALEHIRSMQQSVPGLDRIRLLKRGADELDDFEAASFDTVVINSVVQHFPDLNYLMRVLKGAVRLLRPGGHIFVGDVLNLNLLETFHTSVQVYRAGDGDTSIQLRQRVHQQMLLEKDLQFAPAFFAALPQTIPELSWVQVLPKPGRSHNQLNRYRYDAVLRVGSSEGVLDGLNWTDWQRQRLTLGDLRPLLTNSVVPAHAFRNIPNARLFRDVQSLAWLREAGPDETIGQLRVYLAQQPLVGVEPEDLAALAAETGHRVELSWLSGGAQGLYDAVFSHTDEPFRPAAFAGEIPRRSLSDYANHPQRDRLVRQLIPHLRAFIQEKLPQYMMPAVFQVLDNLPLTPTGKTDRKALEQLPLEFEPAGEEETLTSAHSPLEKLLVEVWTDVLSLRRIGLDDDFFVLGGNSLKAMLATNKLQRRLNRPLEPLAIFGAPTISTFAAHLISSYPDLPEQIFSTENLATEREEGEI